MVGGVGMGENSKKVIERSDNMDNLVYIHHEIAVCDSLQVAEKFEKEHRNVLQNIDNLTAENSAVKELFKVSTYKANNGQMYRKFYMNRDGFSLLAMGFTGQKALEWKLKYINATTWKALSEKNRPLHGRKAARQE